MVAAGVQLNAMDPKSFGDLKKLAREDSSPEALRAASKQFEALFLQMVLKAMRDATPQNGLMDNDQTRLFQALQDQQTAMNMAQGRGIGLADVIFRQMGGEALVPEATSLAESASGEGASRRRFDLSDVIRQPAVPFGASRAVARGEAEDAVQAGGTAGSTAGTGVGALATERGSGQAARLARDISAALGVSETAGDARSVPDSASEFVNRVWPHAVEASRATGIPAHFMVAQAALETGWGKAELRRTDGSASHNLFNIKAGSRWSGQTVDLPVTEYANGRAYTEKSRFRVYESYEHGFRDYANLLRNNPRYAAVLGAKDAEAFAQGLQKAGYATDPMYADKLTRIIGGATLRNALEG